MEMVFKLVQMEQQMRVLHWQTKSYARHKAFGETYEALGDLIDSFTEEYMGKYGRVQVQGPIEVSNMNKDVEGMINEYIEFLIGITNELEETDTNLLNIRDDILGLMNKLKYLLTLK